MGDTLPCKPIPTPIKGSTGDKVNMATSFIQYCAMCEKQIMHPNHSILYCSAACRRKDGAKPLSASILPSSTTTTTTTSPPPTPPRSRATSPSPSLRSQYHTTPVLRTPSDLHDHRSDLDPSEWKPKLGPRAHSEAYRYLSKFHATTIGPENHDEKDRPMYARHKTTMSMSMHTTTTPSLSLGNTPTTAASSFESMYEFSNRPLHPRHNPLYAMSAAARSDDLVTPHIPPAISVEHGIDWSKKTVLKTPDRHADGVGIGALLSHK